jgi:DME family drug/metabolite transporter
MMGELAALGAALSWTVSAMLYGKALSETKPLSANVVRLTCTSAVLVVFLAVIGKLGVLTSLSADVAVLAGISGVIGLGVGDTLYMMSLKSIGVARAVPITCTYPLFSLIWAARFKGELVTLPVGLGAITIVLGIWLLSQENKTNNAGIQKKDLYRGVAFALATAIAWFISITMINMAVKETADLDHALAINAIRITIIAIVFFASSPLISKGLGFGKISRKAVATLLVGGIVALGVGWFFLTYSFIETLESRAVPISSTTPLFSTLAGMAFLREKVTMRNFLGSVVIVAGIFLIFLV